MDWIKIIQIIIAIALTAVILMQNQGAGAGGVFGGGGAVYSAKRGLDKILFRATIVLAVLFVAISIFVLVI